MILAGFALSLVSIYIDTSMWYSSYIYNASTQRPFTNAKAFELVFVWLIEILNTTAEGDNEQYTDFQVGRTNWLHFWNTKYEWMN